jgi:hypothetical protein
MTTTATIEDDLAEAFADLVERIDGELGEIAAARAALSDRERRLLAARAAITGDPDAASPVLSPRPTPPEPKPPKPSPPPAAARPPVDRGPCPDGCGQTVALAGPGLAAHRRHAHRRAPLGLVDGVQALEQRAAAAGLTDDPGPTSS